MVVSPFLTVAVAVFAVFEYLLTLFLLLFDC